MSSAGKIAAVVFAGLAIALAVARLKNVRGGVLEPLPTADKTVFQAGKYFIVTVSAEIHLSIHLSFLHTPASCLL